MTPRRLARWAAIVTAALLVAAVVTQLRPFWWDTRRPGHSLVVFERHRVLLMGGAWARILLVFPVTALGVALTGLVDGESLEARLAKALAATAGVLSAVSGTVAVAIGVTAEEQESGPAVAVLADSLYWVQDNLLTLSLVAFAAALVVISSRLRDQNILPAWGGASARVALVGAIAIPMSFYIGGAAYRSALYAVPAFAAEAAMVLWLLVLARGLTPARVGSPS